MSASGFLLIKRRCESRGRGMKEPGRSSAGAGMAGGISAGPPCPSGKDWCTHGLSAGGYTVIGAGKSFGSWGSA